MKISAERLKSATCEYRETFVLDNGDEIILRMRTLTADEKFGLGVMLKTSPIEAHELARKFTVLGWDNITYEEAEGDPNSGKPVPFSQSYFANLLSSNYDLQSRVDQHIFVKNGMGGDSKRENFTAPPAE